MKTKIIIIVAIVSFLILGISAFFFLSKNPPSSTSATPVGFPVASSSNSTTVNNSSGSSANKTMTVGVQGGTAKITVNDFIDNGVTIPDPSNAGKYYLTSFSSTEFAISYDTSTQFFTIALEQEPIGKVRLYAQQYLQQALGISQNQLCYLNYYLGTDDQTSDTYSGRNLGFSFCPGATALP